MNEKLAAVLIELTKPESRKRFEADPNGFLEQVCLSEVDKLTLASRNRGAVRYQARYGDLSEEQLGKLDFSSSDQEDHTHFAEHEEDHEHDEGNTSLTSCDKKTFGPHTRLIDELEDRVHPTKAKCSMPNSLIVVGTGISVSHLTHEASSLIAAADTLLYCVADAATELELRRLNPNYEDLYRFYANGKPRRETYDEMAERILGVLREGKNVCAAFYGHPGLFVKPAHLALEQARAEGYNAWMCPAASSLDCMIADLGVDLSWDGCQLFEATHFMLRNHKPDVEAGMILFQVGCVGDPSFNLTGADARHFPLLVSRLAESYGEDHRVILYEASQFSICPPRVDVVSIKELASQKVNGITTMYIPPLRRAERDRILGQYFKENAPSYA